MLFPSLSPHTRNGDPKSFSESALGWLNCLLVLGICWFLLTLFFTYLGVHLWSWLFVPEGEFLAEFTPANIGVVVAFTLAPIGATLVLLMLSRVMDRYPKGSLLLLASGGGALVFAIWRYFSSPPPFS